MYNDENREFDPVGGDLPPQPQQDRADLSEEEPDEIVSWYTPRQEEPEEVVNYFVQQRPIPQNVWKQAAKTQRKRRRLWTWLGIGGIALVVVVIVVAVLLSSTASSAPSLPGSDDGDSASSMVDIFRKKETTIPRISGKEGVKLSCQDPSGQELTIQQVYAKVNPSVVAVVAEQSDGSAAVGTGVIMTESGYIITNAHVISGGKSCWVALDTGVTYDARLVGYDEDEDLAVLRAIADNPLPAAEFGNSDLLTVGDPVYAIGNPLGVELRGTLTNGIVSAINREVEMQGRTMTMIQTNAALNNGNSGGPLINSYGQVIGINTMKMSNSSLSEEEATVEGLGFALPISSVSFVVNDLIVHGEFLGTPTIGITVRTIEKSGGGTQVEVYTVDDALGAAEAGVQPGDIILEADGQPVSVTSDLLTVRRTAFKEELMKQHPLQTAGRVRLPYTRRRNDARCVTSASQLPDVPELKAYGPDFFAGHALLLVSDTTASGSLRPTLHTADIADGHGTVRLQHPLPARNQCVTQDMATWLLWAEVPVSWADLSWAVANPALPPERLSRY